MQYIMSPIKSIRVITQVFYSLSEGTLDAVLALEEKWSICFNFLSLMGIFLI